MLPLTVAPSHPSRMSTPASGRLRGCSPAGGQDCLVI